MVDRPRKYARVERERRFLVPTLPIEKPWADRRIDDLYIEGTRIRLRRSVGIVDGEPEKLIKLTQKLPFDNAAGGCQGVITTMYLDDAEYERLSMLPGTRLTKRRLSFPPMGVDVFEGSLAGLLIAEIEFDDDESMNAFAPPSYCSREITTLAEYRGVNLARLAGMTREDVLGRLGTVSSREG